MVFEKSELNRLIIKLKSVKTESFISTIQQIFTYLRQSISNDNVVADEYFNKDFPSWEYNVAIGGQILPEDPTTMKQLSFYAYYILVEATNQYRFALLMHLFRVWTDEDGYKRFNETFYSHFVAALKEIGDEEIYLLETKSVNAVKSQPIMMERKLSQKVFIIHGHDERLKMEVELFLRSIQVTPVILHQQEDRGRTIIEKLIEVSQDAGFAIALFTPDDIQEDLTKRARQNVLLETGYFMGKLGRDRVRMIVREGTEIPSDLSGILHTKFDERWKSSILKELRAAGIEYDASMAIKYL